MSDVQPETTPDAPAEITDAPAITGRPCKQCGGPVPAPKRAGVVKDFCANKCRANWRLDEQRRAVEKLLRNLDDTKAELAQTRAGLVDAAGEIERLAAVTEGAIRFIQQHLVIGHRKQRKVVDTPS